MSIEGTLSAIVLSFFIFLIWRINKKKPARKTGYKVANNASKTVSFDSAINGVLDKQIKANEHSFSFNDVALEKNFLQDFSSFSVFTETSISNEDKQTTDQIVRSFRKPHPLLLPLTQGVFEPNELFDLIKKDPEMTAKVLKVVNSPLFSLRQPITSINHAIIFLGVTSVKNIAMQFAIRTAMNEQEQDRNQEAAYQKLWVASYIASSLCLLIAKSLAKENAAELSTHCLLSYLGDMAIVSHQSQTAENYLAVESLYLRIDKIQHEVNTNSALVGKNIAQQWRLPTSIVKGIEHSLSPLTQQSGTISDVQLADTLICYIACRLGDFVAFNNMTDISQLETLLDNSQNSVNFYFIKDKIDAAGLGQLNTLFSDASFKRKANQIIEQVKS